MILFHTIFCLSSRNTYNVSHYFSFITLMLFSNEDYLSESDKVDRIYKMLRAEQLSRRIALFIRVLFF